ncbi:hypothetical protein [Symbioplanes lichenis]|uniref:hypothetical protein n=1 Tax=Symbioplanes lichenis TaxID=1629072 RepID=UPI002738FF5A|nr:hypothetical protein [Actinoplanes lichenis]
MTRAAVVAAALGAALTVVSITRTRGTADPGGGDSLGADVRKLRVATAPANLEYMRRVYERAIDWYKIAEGKAQLILTVNGAFVTVVFGLLSGNVAGLRNSLGSIGVLTWLFLTLGSLALGGSILAAALSLLSRHETHIRHDFAELAVDPRDETTYCPEALWYYGHLAKLHRRGIQRMVRGVDEATELDVLAYHVQGLAATVLRKHRLINAGWGLTGAALLALLGGAVSLVLSA